MSLEIETKVFYPDVNVLVLSGKLTAGEGSQRVETLVKDLLREKQNKIVLDLSAVGYVDSTGLGVIAFCSAAASEAGGGLCVAGATGIAARLFQVTKLDQIVRFYPTLEEAWKGLA